MKTSCYLIPTTLLSLAAVALTSCSSIKPEVTTSADIKEGVPGGTFTETSKIAATVTAIEPSTRKVTFVTRDGKAFFTNAGPAILNFDQIRVGDQLNVTVTEEIVVRMAKEGEKIEEEFVFSADIAPIDKKPAWVMSDSSRLVAVISEIDLKRQKVKLRFSNGTTKKFDVRKDLDLTKRSIGEKVLIQVTEVEAIKIEKP
ncbi:MAG: hypothetical protein AB8D78_08315 [Akkermansiaceae bacterium]